MLRPRACYCILCPLIGLLILLFLLRNPPAASAQGAPAKAGRISFINDVAPVLKENCFACHDSKKRKGKLDMSTFESFRKGGTKDDPISEGKPGESLIMDLCNGTGAVRMPPKEAGEALPREKIAVIAQWIQEGAKLDAGISAKADLMRELRIRWKPPTPPANYKYPVNINALAFTPDGKHLVVSGYHELTVWDVAQGKLVKRIATRGERAYGMAFLSDGNLVVAGGRPGQEGDGRIYNLGGGMPKVVNGVALLDGVNDRAVLVKELLETDDSVLALALSADGKKLAAGGCDRLVRVWDLAGGAANAKLEQTFENHADWVFGLAFTPDGKGLLTASRDKTAKVWDLAARESALTFPDHPSAVYAVAITADGKTGISAGEDNNVRFWHATDQAKQLGKQIRASGGHNKAIFRMAMSRDAKKPLLATCSADGSVRLWNPDNGAQLKTLTGHTDWLYAVALSPDGALVAAGGWNGEVRVWKTADGTLAKTFNATPGYTPPATVSATPKK
jgi:glucose/arabinose dehydrogenase